MYEIEHLDVLSPSVRTTLLLGPFRVGLTRRQASLDATDRTVASPCRVLTLRFDAGRFPPTPAACYRASWQLAGCAKALMQLVGTRWRRPPSRLRRTHDTLAILADDGQSGWLIRCFELQRPVGTMQVVMLHIASIEGPGPGGRGRRSAASPGTGHGRCQPSVRRRRSLWVPGRV